MYSVFSAFLTTLFALAVLFLGLYYIILYGAKWLRDYFLYGFCLDRATKFGVYKGLALEMLSFVICLYLRFSGKA